MTFLLFFQSFSAIFFSSLSYDLTTEIQGLQTLQWMHRGPTRLFQIILSESAYLIWVLRCERVIQEKPLTEGEIKARWYRAINDRLTINKTTATKIVRTNRFKKLMDGTWGPALRKGQELPVNWMHDREVLVGRTA